MKSKFFLLGLCALALASCSIDEVSQVNDTNAISFKATATRATAATTNTIDGFTVWAWEKVGDGTTEFMKGVQANKSGSVFITAPTYYWPGAALDFYAFIPAATVETDSSSDYDAYFGEYVSLAGDIIETANGVTYDSYEGYVANATITSSSAISFDMHVPADAAKEIDLGYAVTLGQSTGTVGLNFRHALSQVAFKAMNGNADWNVDIKGVTLCGIYKEGTYTLPEFDEYGTTVHNASDAEKGEWTIKDGAVQGRFDAGIAETKMEGASAASESITAENGALMLIPQTVKEWDPLTDPTNTALGAYIRINCHVIDTATGEQIWPNYNETDSTGEPLEYAEITVPFEVDWVEGSLYTYTIVFGEGLGYYAPDDPDTDLDGQPVLIPIRFTVDIDDFGNTEEVDVSTETEEAKPLVLEYTIRSSDNTVELPIADVTKVEIDWGDGETETTTSDNPSHTYSNMGTYTVSIIGTAGSLNGAVYSSDTGKYSARDGWDCLIAVVQWGNMKFKSMDYAFYNCDYLKSLPDGPGPFENVTSFSHAFYDCIELKEVPKGIFENCAKATSFEYVFGHCYSMTDVPEDTFKNCIGSTSFRGVFASCTLLTAAPTFKGLSKVEDFYEAFDTCTSLTTVPVDIFSGCTAVTNFNWTFSSCSAVSGESPYEEILVGNETVKVHLYERANYPDYFTTPTSYSRCFQRSTFSDMDSIPSSWGGNKD